MWIFYGFLIVFRFLVFMVFRYIQLPVQQGAGAPEQALQGKAHPPLPYKVGHIAASSKLRYFPTGLPQVIHPSNRGTRSIKEFLVCWRSISKQNALILKFSGSFLCAAVYFWSLRPYGVCSPIKSSKAISTDLRMDIKRT